MLMQNEKHGMSFVGMILERTWRWVKIYSVSFKFKKYDLVFQWMVKYFHFFKRFSLKYS